MHITLFHDLRKPYLKYAAHIWIHMISYLKLFLQIHFKQTPRPCTKNSWGTCLWKSTGFYYYVKCVFIWMCYTNDITTVPNKLTDLNLNGWRAKPEIHNLAKFCTHKEITATVEWLQVFMCKLHYFHMSGSCKNRKRTKLSTSNRRQKTDLFFKLGNKKQ